jgi:regulator of replication initiation timing
MKKSIRHILMLTAGLSAATYAYADDDSVPFDGISSIVLEIGRNATASNSDITDISASHTEGNESCNLLSPQALDARVAGVGMFLDSVQNRLPAMDGTQVVDQFVTRDRSMSQKISTIESQFALQLQQQIAVLDAENAELRARLDTLVTAKADQQNDAATDTEAMAAIKNAEQALAAARAAIGGK